MAKAKDPDIEKLVDSFDRLDRFKKAITKGYTFKGSSIVMGTSMLDDQAVKDNQVKVPLKTFNRHGLIAGATGTGKTKTLQNIAERLSENGVGVLLMDIKGDLSGLSQPGKPHPKIDERHEKICMEWKARGYPCELMTISKDKGVRLRATISEFGPVLLSKILGLNDTQTGVVSLIFKYCDDEGLLLLDIKDFRKVLQFVTDEGKEDIEEEYGRISTASVGAIMRKLIEIEEQGADLFFGEKSFDVEDLLRRDRKGNGFINILRLTDIQGKPKLFSTFMLCLLAEIYETLPEVGDMDKPKLVVFIDEAHLIFKNASQALQDQLETMIKLIRSKGVGIFFCTQTPTDVPEEILGQLGMKFQHALRAFTAKDRKAIKLAAENYPLTEFYKINQELTKLGIGEALITVLNEKGVPTPVVRTLLRAPSSRMDVITKAEKNAVLKASKLMDEYNEVIDRKSAYEILEKKMEKYAKDKAKDEKSGSRRRSKSRSGRKRKSVVSKTMGRVGSRILTILVREISRGILGVLGLKKTRRRRRR